jgi:hypothetical protein
MLSSIRAVLCTGDVSERPPELSLTNAFSFHPLDSLLKRRMCSLYIIMVTAGCLTVSIVELLRTLSKLSKGMCIFRAF